MSLLLLLHTNPSAVVAGVVPLLEVSGSIATTATGG